MDRLSVFVIFSIILGVALGARLSDSVRKMHFIKLTDGSDEYEFEYDLDSGDKFRGQTYLVLGTTYFMFGAEGEIYWANIDTSDSRDNEFTETVRKAERNGDIVDFEDDFSRYSMSIHGNFAEFPYATQWDLKNICFTTAENQTFDFKISSLNNSRKYSGTTYRKTDDPKIQRLELVDHTSIESGVYEIHFTDVQLLSDEQFCRGFDDILNLYGAQLSTSVGMWVNPSLLKTMVG